jgi:hypothetical protein
VERAFQLFYEFRPRCCAQQRRRECERERYAAQRPRYRGELGIVERDRRIERGGTQPIG